MQVKVVRSDEKSAGDMPSRAPVRFKLNFGKMRKDFFIPKRFHLLDLEFLGNVLEMKASMVGFMDH